MSTTAPRLLQVATQAAQGVRATWLRPDLARRLPRAFLSTAADASHGPRAAHLAHRGLLRLTGPDTASVLQGLVTNDVRRLAAQPSLYAFLLSPQGRVLFDSFIYTMPAAGASEAPDDVLLECDRALLPSVLRHLRRFKLRAKVELSDCSDEFAVHAVFGAKEGDTAPEAVAGGRDPRGPVASLGLRRIVLPTGAALDGTERMDPTEYTAARVALGLAEGPVDIPVKESFPLESNLDLLDGVTWDKGCYLGQELTARTHFTGVTRKRLLPLRLCDEHVTVPPGSRIVNAKGRVVGRTRSQGDGLVLALFRLAHLQDEVFCIPGPADGGSEDGDEVGGSAADAADPEVRVRVEPALPSWLQLER